MSSVDRFADLVAKAPDNALFRFSLAKALCDAQRWDEAVPHLKICCESRSDWMLPRILLGRTWIAVGDRQAAKEILEVALELARGQGHEDPEVEILGLLSELAK
jgi:predicted Zn-dependent protease